MTGGWVFTPNPKVTVDVADADYLNYGFWLKKTTDEDGVLTYNEVQTFAGSNLDRSADLANVTGSAAYKGGATGVYVHSVLKTDGTRESATAGQFKADAELTATFGQVTGGDRRRRTCRDHRAQPAELHQRDYQQLRPGARRGAQVVGELGEGWHHRKSRRR